MVETPLLPPTWIDQRILAYQRKERVYNVWLDESDHWWHERFRGIMEVDVKWFERVEEHEIFTSDVDIVRERAIHLRRLEILALTPYVWGPSSTFWQKDIPEY